MYYTNKVIIAIALIIMSKDFFVFFLLIKCFLQDTRDKFAAVSENTKNPEFLYTSTRF